VSCKKATVVAEKMKEIYQDKLDLQIYRTDSIEAVPYKLRSSTNLFVNDKLVPLDVAISETALENYLNVMP
jgi:hypothetical protein